MENRKIIEECIKNISERLNEFKNFVNNTSDESLNNLLDAAFGNFAGNIDCNFDFMELLITRKLDDESGESQELMTDEELHEYFMENIELLIGECF
jgi:hypothetical protein